MVEYRLSKSSFRNLVIGTYIIPTDKINYIAKTLEFIFDDDLNEVPKYGIRINVGPRTRDINFSYDTEEERDSDFEELKGADEKYSPNDLRRYLSDERREDLRQD